MRALFSLDLRDAIRSLRATPVLTAVAIVSLALGIGANTALFSIVNGLMLRPLPARDAGRLALIDDSSWTNPIWEQIRDRHADLFDGALAWSNETFDLSLGGETEPIDGIYASGRLFEVLGVGAVLGRVLGPADDVRGGGPEGAVAVISHGLWQRRFGGAPDVIGRQLTIQRVPVTIVGVTGRDFYGPEVGRQAHIFVPLAVEAAVRGRDSALDRRSSWWLNIMIRRRPDQPLEAAAAALNQRRPAIRDATMPDNYPPEAKGGYLGTDFRLSAAAGGRSTLRSRFAQPLTVILIVVGGVLLIACANLANLMLARASGRRRELSVRLALGASRGRLARQLLVEAFLLAAAGSIAGLAIAKWGGALLVRQLGATVALDSRSTGASSASPPRSGWRRRCCSGWRQRRAHRPRAERGPQGTGPQRHRRSPLRPAQLPRRRAGRAVAGAGRRRGAVRAHVLFTGRDAAWLHAGSAAHRQRGHGEDDGGAGPAAGALRAGHQAAAAVPGVRRASPSPT